jgi:AcrR family transcriptional regulator
MPDPVDRAPARFSGDMRTALIEAAVACITEVGLEGMTLRAVARRAGVTHQAPYRHFADRGALLAAVAEDGFERLHARNTEQLASAGSPEARLQALARSQLAFALARPTSYHVMFCRELADKSPYPSLQRVATRAFELVAATVAEAQRAERFRRTDVQDQTILLVSFVHGLTSLLIDGQFRRRGLTKASAPADLDRLLGVLLDGFRAK